MNSVLMNMLEKYDIKNAEIYMTISFIYQKIHP